MVRDQASSDSQSVQSEKRRKANELQLFVKYTSARLCGESISRSENYRKPIVGQKTRWVWRFLLRSYLNSIYTILVYAASALPAAGGSEP